jgi:hypothetical protein
MRTIRHITYGSAIKVGAVLTALLYALIGFFFFIGSVLGGAAFTAFGVDAGAAAGAGAVIGIITWIVMIIGGLIGGAITGVIVAFFYNITAAIVGGLEIDLGE